jgi:hypothetical protein
MEELLELKSYIHHQQYDKALLLINDMEEMAKEDKLHKIRSYAIILLIHLIKQDAESRSSRSWERSIKNAVGEIKYINKRRKSGGYYNTAEELQETLEDAYLPAMRYASEEAFGGLFDEDQLAEKVDKQEILEKAFQLIQ